MSGSRTYVVTGSVSGIGSATRVALEAEGHRVIGVDLRGAEIEVDLGSPEGRAKLRGEAVRLAPDGIDGVVACAGVTSPAALSVNYFGAVATLAGLQPLLLQSTAGRAVAIASFASISAEADPEVVGACLGGDEERANRMLESMPARTAYAASKAALCRWIRRAAVSADWAGWGLPLNAVAPGIVVTPMTQPILAQPSANDVLRARVPMPLCGPARPEQIAPLLVWLASEENTHTTGQVVFIDGGAEAVVRGDTVW